jgi:hypothetical protein
MAGGQLQTAFEYASFCKQRREEFVLKRNRRACLIHNGVCYDAQFDGESLLRNLGTAAWRCLRCVGVWSNARQTKITG